MASGKMLRSYRITEQSKLDAHYSSNTGPAKTLNRVLEALLLAGVDPDLLVPQGATNPLALEPTDSPVSEWLNRQHEALFGRPNPNSPYAPTAFRRDYNQWYSNVEFLLIALSNLGVKGRLIAPLFDQMMLCAQLDVMRGLNVPDPDPVRFPSVAKVMEMLAPKPDDYVYREDSW